jgi:hypothetical protein
MEPTKRSIVYGNHLYSKWPMLGALLYFARVGFLIWRKVFSSYSPVMGRNWGKGGEIPFCLREMAEMR